MWKEREEIYVHYTISLNVSWGLKIYSKLLLILAWIFILMYNLAKSYGTRRVSGLDKYSFHPPLRIFYIHGKTFWKNENSIIQFSLTFYIWIQSIFQYDKKQLHHFCFRQLLTAVLQFMLSVSAYKSQVLLYRLDVNLLGKSSASKVY